METTIEVKVEAPVIVFRLPGDSSRQCAFVRFTRYAYYNRELMCTIIVCLVDPFLMQRRGDRKNMFWQLKAFYESYNVGRPYGFLYHEKGYNITLNKPL